jgi:TIR domain
MSKIFVSYKREDEVRVGRLVRALEEAPLPVWWDRNLPSGENWRSQIQDGLNNANCSDVIARDCGVPPPQRLTFFTIGVQQEVNPQPPL